MKFTLKPLPIEAFQFFPTVSIPDWFEKEVIEGRALIVIDDTKTSYVSMKNKRTKGYIGYAGDWVVKDSFGHIHIISVGTFEERTDKVEE